MTSTTHVEMETVSDKRLAEMLAEMDYGGNYTAPQRIIEQRSILTELLALRAKQAPSTPDHCYDPDDWEYSMPWEDRNELVEAWDVNKPYRVATLIDGPMKWVVVLWDEENGGETRWFDSETEAVAALPASPLSEVTK